MDIVNLDYLRLTYETHQAKKSLKHSTQTTSLKGGFSIQRLYSLVGMTQPTSLQTFSLQDFSVSTMPVSTDDFSEYFCHGDSSCSTLTWESLSNLPSEGNLPSVVSAAGRKALNGGIFSFGYSSIRT